MDQAHRIRWAVTVVLGIVVALVTAKILRAPADLPAPPVAEAPADEPSVERTRTLALDQQSPRGPTLKPPPKATGVPPEGSAGAAESVEGRAEAPNSADTGRVPYELDSPGSLTQAAREQPLMTEVGPDDVRYDSVVEAAQLFAPFEDTLLETDPLTPEAWKAALETHRERNGGVMKRADFLRQSGFADEAGEMMIEWSRLYGLYQAKAYGR